MEGFNQCSKGHFYKEDKTSCPYCPENNSSGDIKTEFLSKTESTSEDQSLKTQVFGGQSSSESTNTKASTPNEPFDATKTMIVGAQQSPSSDISSPQARRRLRGWLVSFDIEDLDESNLKGSANATAEMTFYFDSEWLVQSQKTSIDVQAEVRNGALRNYSPLQELSSFVDRDELSRIDFPYLKGPFQIRGDTLIIPETQVNNSAINFWVNGWQNLETDAIEYSIRIGLKDLALRGKNSNRDLGQWVAEAETENQPYMRLLVGCNLDDPCISLDKKQIRTSLKSTLKQEKEDLKTLFKRDEKEDEENDLNKGNFELLWPESDSLSIHITP